MKTLTDENLKPRGETTAREAGTETACAPAAEGGMLRDRLVERKSDDELIRAAAVSKRRQNIWTDEELELAKRRAREILELFN